MRIEEVRFGFAVVGKRGRGGGREEGGKDGRQAGRGCYFGLYLYRHDFSGCLCHPPEHFTKAPTPNHAPDLGVPPRRLACRLQLQHLVRIPRISALHF
jgi:hypothetical protein